MAKTEAPLLSLSASGAIANTLVYGKWKGRNYARGYAVPAKKRSPAQLRTRSVFTWVMDVWVSAPTILKAPFHLSAEGIPKTGENVFMGKNIRSLHDQTDITRFIASPGVNNAPGLDSVNINPATNHFEVQFSPPPVPPGWVFEAEIATAILQQNPQSGEASQVHYAEQFNPSSNPNVVGLQSMTEYVISAWIRWARPDGSIAYSKSVTQTGTTL